LERRRLAVLLVLLAAYAALALRYVYATSFVVDGARVFTLWDDAMISMRYAQNLAAGDGLVWNPGGERVQGISNPGVALVMALLHLLPLQVFHTSLAFQLLNVGLLAAVLALAWRAAEALFPGDRAVGPLAALSLALYAPLAVWSLQGSDVGAIACAVFAALWLAARADAAGRPWPLAAWLALALGVAVRLDTALIYAAFLGAAGVAGPRRARSLAVGGAVLAAALAAVLGLGWLYYGDPLPNTYYLKATGAPRELVLANGLGQLLAMLTPASVPLWLFGAGALALLAPRRAALLAAAATACGLVAYDVWVGGDWIFTLHSRFVVPGVALYLVLHVGAVRLVLARLAPRALRGTRGLAVAAPLALAGLFAFFAPAALRELWLLEPETVLRRENEWNVRLGLLLRDHTRPDTTVAVHWAGIPIYFSGRPGIDVLGKSDRTIARQPIRARAFAPGHSKWDWDYVLGVRRPDVISGASHGLLGRADFRRDYLGVQTPVALPNGAFLIFYARRDATGKLLGSGFRFHELGAGPAPAP
jgi:hypothetical protein